MNINKFLGGIVLLIVSASILSCMTINVKDGQKLIASESEGYLLASISINKIIKDQSNWSISIMPRNKPSDIGPFTKAVAVLGNIKKGENFVFIKLPKGKYTFKYVYLDPFAFEVEDAVFQVEANKINYVGNIDINVTNNSKYFPFFEYRYSDLFPLIKESVLQKYPILEKTYELVNNCVLIFNGYKQPIQRM